MSSPLHPEVLRLREESHQEALPWPQREFSATCGKAFFGSMLIEVVDGAAYVNGDRVERINPVSADGHPLTPPRGA